MPRRTRLTALPLLFATSTLGCTTILGGFDFDGPTTTTGTGGAGGMASTSTSSSGTGGTGGTGGAPVCTQGETKPCYTGPAGTEGKGICKAGVATCLPDGTGFGACAGDVGPDPNGEDCAKLGDEDCDGQACSDPVVTSLFGDGADQRVTSMAVDEDGNIIVAGYFQGTLALGSTTLTSAGSNDYFVAKFDPAGAPTWSRRYGDTGDNGNAIHVAVDSTGNVLLASGLKGTLDFGVCGQLSSAIATAPVIGVAKLNPSGNCVWAARYGNGLGFGQSPSGITTTSQGDVVMTASLDGSITFGSGATQQTLSVKNSGYSDALLVKLGADGSYQWARKFTDPTSASPTTSRGLGSPRVDAAGNIYFSGAYTHSVAIDSTTLSYTGSGGAVLLAKFDGAGSVLKAQSYGGQTGYSSAPGLSVSGTQVVVFGWIGDPIDFGGGALALQGQYDGFVAAFDPNLNHYWSMRFGDPNDISGSVDTGASISSDKDGNVLLAGWAYGELSFGNGPSFTAQGMRDMFITKLDPMGKHLWSKLLGDGADQVPSGVGADPNTGHVILAGSTQGTIEFGAGPKTSAGGYDIFLATFQP